MKLALIDAITMRADNNGTPPVTTVSEASRRRVQIRGDRRKFCLHKIDPISRISPLES